MGLAGRGEGGCAGRVLTGCPDFGSDWRPVPALASPEAIRDQAVLRRYRRRASSPAHSRQLVANRALLARSSYRNRARLARTNMLLRAMSEEVRRAVHFVGFRGEEYGSAVRAFGKPDFIHMGWDRRARRDIDLENDLIVFARGPHDQPFAERNFDDIREPSPSPY